MNVSPNRVVAVATPLVFAPLAGTIAALAAKYAPGLDIDQGQLEAVFIAGATIALAKSGLWLKGWQDYEKRQQTVQAVAAESADDPYIDSEDGRDGDIEDEFDADFDDPDFDADLDDRDLDADLDYPDFDDEIEEGERDDLLVGQRR